MAGVLALAPAAALLLLASAPGYALPRRPMAARCRHVLGGREPTQATLCRMSPRPDPLLL
jgi:hypothetical protein